MQDTPRSDPLQGDTRPAGGETLARAANGAHRAVDATVAKVAPVVDAVHDKVVAVREVAQGVEDTAARLQSNAEQAKDAAAAWLSAAREVVRAHPLAAVGGALLIGAAYMSLSSKGR